VALDDTIDVVEDFDESLAVVVELVVELVVEAVVDIVGELVASVEVDLIDVVALPVLLEVELAV
jgi:hypothetical protein